MPMYNDNNRKLRTVLLVLAIVLVLLRIVKTAHAEGTDNYLSQIESAYFASISSSNVTAIENLIDQYDMKYFFIGREGGTAGDYYGSCGQAIIVFSDQQGIYIPAYLRCQSSPSYSGIRDTYYNDTSSLYFAFNYNQYSVQVWPDYSSNPFTGTAHFIAIWQDWNGNPWARYFTYDYNNGVASNYQSYPIGSITYGNYYANAITVTNYVSYGDFYAFSPVTSGGQCYLCYSSYDMNPYVSDSRLKFWTFDNLDGSETLVTDLSEFLQGTEGVMDNQISGLVITYELDNIEHTLILDSSNSVIRRSGTATSYRVETPFSAFGFDSSVTTFDITKCDFTLTYSAYGYSTTENYKISCDFPAFRQSSPVEPAVIPSPDVSDPAVDSSVYTFIDTVYGSYSSDRYGRSGTWDVSSNEPSDVSVFRSVDVYHFANEEHGSGVDESIYYYSLLDWSNTQLDIAAYTVFDWDIFLSENTSALYFDVISVPIYHFTPVGQSSTISGRVFDGYALFYTPSYFLRQQYGLLGDILTVVDQDAQNQYNNGIWLVDKINDFEDKTLDALNASLDIETDSLSWLKTLDNSIKSLDFPDFDDSSILSGIASIVTALSGDNDDLGVNGRLDKLINFFVANDAERNDSALTYRNWLDGLDPTETRRVTHFGTNIYSLVKNIFDIFDADYTEDPSFENPDKDYLGIASDYIDALNNRNNTNKFFRGFFDSSFDPLEQSGLPEE